MCKSIWHEQTGAIHSIPWTRTHLGSRILRREWVSLWMALLLHGPDCHSYCFIAFILNWFWRIYELGFFFFHFFIIIGNEFLEQCSLLNQYFPGIPRRQYYVALIFFSFFKALLKHSVSLHFCLLAEDFLEVLVEI